MILKLCEKNSPSLSPKNCNTEIDDYTFESAMNHLQNVAKEPDDNKKISFDQYDCIFSERDMAAIIDSTGECLGIMSHKDL